MRNTDKYLVNDVDYRPYLKTLRRIPREVRQSMATREFEMGSPWTCVCGWAMRDDIIHATGIDSGANSDGVIFACTQRFGGSYEEWEAIFGGVCYPHNLAAIETAFTIAVAETVRA